MNKVILPFAVFSRTNWRVYTIMVFGVIRCVPQTIVATFSKIRSNYIADSWQTLFSKTQYNDESVNLLGHIKTLIKYLMVIY